MKDCRKQIDIRTYLIHLLEKNIYLPEVNSHVATYKIVVSNIIYDNNFVNQLNVSFFSLHLFPNQALGICPLINHKKDLNVFFNLYILNFGSICRYVLDIHSITLSLI